MRFNFVAFCTLMVLGAAFAVPGPAQVGGQVASPPAKADCKFSDGKTIHVDYSSPRMRGRKIFGGLVPFGEPWRAGANEATTFVIDADMNVGGKDGARGKLHALHASQRRMPGRSSSASKQASGAFPIPGSRLTSGACR